MPSRLKFQRMGRDIGNIELRESLLGCARIIIGGPANKGEAGERDHGIHRWHTIAHEVRVHRRAGIQPRGEYWDHVQPLRLKRVDHAVIVARIIGQHIGTQKHQADCALGTRPRQQIRAFHDASLGARVIKTDFRILDRRFNLQPADHGLARPGCVAVDQHADHIRDIIRRTSQPVLKRQEIGADVLCGAGDEAQQLRQFPQHLHLALAAGRRSARLGLAAQFLQQAGNPLGLASHAELTESRQPHDLGRR